MFTLVRTTGSDPRLPALIAELDADLRARYGAIQAQYVPFNHIKDETPFVVAVASDGAALACGSFRPYDGAPAAIAGAIELKRMFVARAARRRGVARALIRELETWAREQGFTVAVLETGDRQTEAIALYEQCGYARTPLFPPYVGMPASVCMRKAL